MLLKKEVEKVTFSLWGVMEFIMDFYLNCCDSLMSYFYYSRIYFVLHFLVHS